MSRRKIVISACLLGENVKYDVVDSYDKLWELVRFG